MTFLSRIRQIVMEFIIELPARMIGIDRVIRGLEKNGQAIEKRIATANDRANNREALAHVIGIERWGQQRLRVALGEPLVVDEYDAYRPESEDWPGLITSFHATRQSTISLSKSLRMARVDPHMRIQHNQFGEISLLGWLYYLNLHSSLESKRIN